MQQFELRLLIEVPDKDLNKVYDSVSAIIECVKECLPSVGVPSPHSWVRVSIKRMSDSDKQEGEVRP
jgi:hypothetical protein